jgi:site-specific DNA recombinase
LFRAVQAKLHANQTNTSPARERTWALSGLLFCGHCGAPLWCIPTTLKQGERSYTYLTVACSRRRCESASACPDSGTEHHEELLRLVVKTIQTVLGDPGAVDQLRADIALLARQRAEEIDKERQALRKRQGEMDAQITTWTRRLLDLPADIQPEALAEVRRLKAERETLVVRLAELDAEETAAEAAGSSRAERALALVGELDKLLHRADQDELRDTLRALVQRVAVHYRPVKPEDRKGKGRTRGPCEYTIERGDNNILVAVGDGKCLGPRKLILQYLDITLHPCFTDLLTEDRERC